MNEPNEIIVGCKPCKCTGKYETNGKYFMCRECKGQGFLFLYLKNCKVCRQRGYFFRMPENKIHSCDNCKGRGFFYYHNELKLVIHKISTGDML